MSLLTIFFSAAAGIVAPVRQPPADARDASQIIGRFIRVLTRLKSTQARPPASVPADG